MVRLLARLFPRVRISVRACGSRFQRSTYDEFWRHLLLFHVLGAASGSSCLPARDTCRDAMRSCQATASRIYDCYSSFGRSHLSQHALGISPSAHWPLTEFLSALPHRCQVQRTATSRTIVMSNEPARSKTNIHQSSEHW